MAKGLFLQRMNELIAQLSLKASLSQTLQTIQSFSGSISIWIPSTSFYRERKSMDDATTKHREYHTISVYSGSHDKPYAISSLETQLSADLKIPHISNPFPFSPQVAQKPSFSSPWSPLAEASLISSFDLILVLQLKHNQTITPATLPEPAPSVKAMECLPRPGPKESV